MTNSQQSTTPTIKTFVFPGGSLPVQGRPSEDAGYDVFTRAIVHQDGTDKDGARRTIWDLTGPPDKGLNLPATTVELNGIQQWAYRLDRHQSIRIGIGVAFGMENNWYAALVPRSSAAGKLLHVLPSDTVNWYGHVPIDPGFHGEPTALITNYGAAPILITKDWRPAQLVFYCECCKGQGFVRPVLQPVDSLTALGKSSRGTASHGSSGTHGKPDSSGQLSLFKAA